jgi:pyrroline-5-carboxylate reductase
MWLDKTGTLTEGRATLVRWQGDEAVKPLVAAAEAHSSHPLARAALRALGEERQVDDEEFVAMATALSGTGPTYLFAVMEALIDAGVHLGFPRELAHDLVAATLIGSAEYAARSELHPAQLRNLVTSPGGTSAAAIYELEKGRLRTVLSDAVWAAYRRTQELGARLEAETEPPTE